MSGSNPYPTAPPQGYVPNTYYGQCPGAYQYQQPQGIYPTVQATVAPSYGTAPPYTEAPPPYTEHAQNPQVGIQQPVCFQGAFDYRARFDGIAQPNIPLEVSRPFSRKNKKNITSLSSAESANSMPPPPGVAPNQAQVAAMQGHQVTATQQRRDVFW